MAQSKAVAIDKNIDKYDKNDFELLKKSEKDGTLEEFLKDKDKKNSLAFFAAEQDEKDCLRILLDQGVNLSVVIKNEETVFDAIFDNVSNPEKFLSEVLDSKVDLQKTSDGRDKIYKLDFSLLRPEEHNQMAVISSLFEATSDRTISKVLKHPLFEIYLQLKWSKVVYFFYFWILIKIMSVFCTSLYVTFLTHKSKYRDEILSVLTYIQSFSVPTISIYELIQAWLLNPASFCKFKTWINLIAPSLLMLVQWMIEHEDYSRLEDIPKWVLHIASFVILLFWIELLMLIGTLTEYEYYTVMFCVVFKNVVKVLLILMCLVVGFALSFSIQFCHLDDFSNAWEAIVTTASMMMGEFDYVEIFDNSNVSGCGGSPTFRVTFVLFVILTSIVLMNLLIVLTMNDIHSLKQEAYARKFKTQAEFLAQIEQFMNKTNLPFLKRLINRVQIEKTKTVDLNASEKFPTIMKFSSEIRGALLEIVQSKRIKNLHSGNSNKVQ